MWVNALEKRAEELATANVTLTVTHTHTHLSQTFPHRVILMHPVCVRQNEVSLLRAEVTRLKELLLAHKDCPVTAMQKKAYLGKR